MIIYKKQIQNKQVIFEVDEKIPSNKLGGLPLLIIDDKLIAVIYPVDTLTVIKAIANANKLTDISEGVKGTWAEESVEESILELL